MRKELSKKNKFYISKHRRYELEHWVAQYYEWKEEIRKTNLISSNNYDRHVSYSRSDVTSFTAIRLSEYSEKIKMVEDTAKDVDPYMSEYILMCVVDGLSYEKIKARFNIPCCKDTFYDLVRQFFYILSAKRK